MKKVGLHDNKFHVRNQPQILIIATILIVLLLVSGQYYATREFKTIRSAKTIELELIGTTKMNQISEWFADEIFDAYTIARNEIFQQVTGDWYSTKKVSDSLRLAEFVSSYAREHSYFTIFLVDNDGKLLISSTRDNPEIDPLLLPFIKDCGNLDSTYSTDLYRSQKSKNIWIDFLTKAETSDGLQVGVWVFRFDPALSLYPIIDAWPKPLESTETYLGRLEENLVRVLNNLKFKEDCALNFTYTLDQQEAAIVMAANGLSGVRESIDYRGEKVMAYINKVPGTPWLIVTKTDSSEVFEEAFLELGFLISVILLAILLVLAGAYLLHRSIRRDSIQTLFKAHEEFRTVVQNVNAIVFIIDQNGIFELSEGLGLSALGLKPGEVIGLSAKELYKDYPGVVAGIDKVLEGKANQVELLVQGIIFDTLFTPRFDQQGKVTGAIGLATNITERYAAAEAIKQREIWFRRLADTTSTAIFIYQNNCFVYVNRTCTELTGYSEAELLGMNFWEIVHMESKELVKDRGHARLRGETVPSRYEFRIIQKNGHETWVDFTAGEIDWQGLPAGIGTAIDITQRKKSEIIYKLQYNIADAAVRSKKMKDLFGIIRNELSTVIDTTNCFFVDYDKSTGMLTVPFEKDELDEIPTAFPADGSLTGLLIKNGKTLLLSSAEIRQLAADDKIRLIGTVAESWLGVPILIHNVPAGALVVQNYTKANAYDAQSAGILEMIANQLSVYIERNQVEETAIKLAKSIEQSPVSIIITNLKGNIEYVNPMFCKSTGYSIEEIIGENPRILKSGDQPEDFYENLWKTILSGNDWHGEFHNRKKNGELFWENGIISPIVNEAGRITHFIAVKEDVSERRKMIEDLIIAKEHAEESDRLKSAFLANMSHEIRTPMNAIIGFSELLNDPDTTPDEREKYTYHIQQRSFDLLAIINDILDLSSLESNQLRMVEEAGCIADLFSDTYHVGLAIKNDLKKIDVQFTCTVEGELANIKIVTDWRRVRQVLNNVINNAFKFTPSGFIQVSCGLWKDDFIKFTVADSGIGIEKEKLEAVFERFVQADDSLSRQHGGAGLGLPICKGLVDLLGGHIDLVSTPSKGSVFSFTIPFRQVNG